MVSFVGCVDLPDDSLASGSNDIDDINELDIPEDFNFATTKMMSIKVYTYDSEDNGLAYIPVNIHSSLSDSAENVISTGATTEAGLFETTIEFPTSLDSIYLYTDYLGLPDWHRVSTAEDEIIYNIGGSNPSDGIVDRYTPQDNGENFQSDIQARRASNPTSKYVYKASFDNNGVPSNLLPDRDFISQDLLDLVNASLPEKRPVPVYNPEYIADDIKSDVILSKESEAWITFVHEGAGYRNALGYYYYPTDSVPQTIDDIDSLFIVFPNASLNRSGGGLVAGDKVYLGKFPANTSIGFFLVPNGWTGRGVNQGIGGEIKYSDKQLNTYTSEAYRNHVALLRDDVRELLILGMEDITRPGGDKDFNDAIFYITLSEFDALVVDNIAETKTDERPDDDEDGIPNVNDEYPNDPLRAFRIKLPGIEGEGSLMFEDFWPKRGDYDFNDLIVNYNYEIVTNSANKIIDLDATFKIQAIGAGFRNGFGFQLDIDPSKVSSATGANLSKNIVTLASNGTEANQRKATFIVFDDAFALMRNPNGGFVNTQNDQPYVEPVEINMAITFTEPIFKNDLGFSPFNPFIFVNGNRSVEVHLADYAPTDLADASLFGTEDDRSNATNGTYYKSTSNLPWALHFGANVDYPTEKISILKVFNQFKPWAESGGQANKSWYSEVSDPTKKFIK